MSGLRQNGHFSVFSGYFNKVVLGNVKVEIWSLTLFPNENNDGLVSI